MTKIVWKDKEESRQVALKAIQKKLVGKVLGYREIFAIMEQVSEGKMSDILTTYFVASGYSRGLSDREIYHMAKAMVETGEKLSFEGVAADKHSIGGIPGTRVTMILVPIIAALGIKIPCTPSRAITTPAGTADDMELLAPVSFSASQIKKIVEKTGGCIVWGGGLNLAPADDEIIKVEKPLFFESYDKIIISIMAKKIATGNTHILIEVPWGHSMKIKHLKDAQKTARKFRSLGRQFDIKTDTLIIHTKEPAGKGIGPALEVRDVLRVLQQKRNRPLDLEKRALFLTGRLIDLCRKEKDVVRLVNNNGFLKEAETGLRIGEIVLRQGLAWKKMQEIISAQGGRPDVDSEDFKPARYKKSYFVKKRGQVSRVNCRHLSVIARILGAPVDKRAGIYLNYKLGDKVKKGQALFTLYSSDKIRLREAYDTLDNLPPYIVG